MRSYDKLLSKYEQFAKTYEALKQIRPRRLYKITDPSGDGYGGYLGDWFLGILHQCTQSYIFFNLVAADHESFDDVKGYAVSLFRLHTYKIEQLKMTDLPAYVSAPYKTELYEKLLMRKVKILED